MSGEDNKAVVRQFVEEFWNKGRMAAADELMTPDATIVLPGRGRVNKEAFKMFARALRDGFPDWHSTIEELVAENDQVGERWTGRGTHKGEFQGIAPTGKHMTVPGFVMYRIVSGKITAFHGLLDGMAMLQQLGVLYTPEQVRAESR